MPNTTIAHYLQQDYTDRTAAAVQTANPGRFSSPTDVPFYMYQSLKTILVPTQTTAQFQAKIVTIYGAGLVNSDLDVAVITQSSEDVGNTKGFRSDQPGAENAKVGLFFRLQDSTSPTLLNTLKLAELRARYILDATILGQSRRTKDNLPMSAAIDPNIDPNFYFKCFWDGFQSPVNVQEIFVAYRVQFVRTFGA